MLALTKRTEYALIALHFIIHQGAVSRPATQGAMPEPVSAREIAQRYNLPLGLLMNVLKKLAGEHLLLSVRGPKGGYVLARDARQLSLARLIEAVEGPVTLVECACEAEGSVKEGIGCSLTQMCPIKRPLKNLHQKMMDFLKSTSVHDICAYQDEAPLTQLSMTAMSCG